MEDRPAWDSKVKDVTAATKALIANPPQKIRKLIKPRGLGSGRPRKEATTAAACLMRRVNAWRYIDQLVCASQHCDRKGCTEHCVLCRNSLVLDAHGNCPVLSCKYCRRVTAATCAGINRAQAATLRHSFVCKDCSVLLPDLHRG